MGHKKIIMISSGILVVLIVGLLIFNQTNNKIQKDHEQNVKTEKKEINSKISSSNSSKYKVRNADVAFQDSSNKVDSGVDKVFKMLGSSDNPVNPNAHVAKYYTKNKFDDEFADNKGAEGFINGLNYSTVSGVVRTGDAGTALQSQKSSPELLDPYTKDSLSTTHDIKNDTDAYISLDVSIQYHARNGSQQTKNFKVLAQRVNGLIYQVKSVN